VDIEYVGDYQLIEELSVTYKGEELNESQYRLITTVEHFLSICTDEPLPYSEFIKNCIEFNPSMSKEYIAKILKTSDLVVSLLPILSVRRGTDFVKTDGCQYLERELVDVLLKEEVEGRRLYVYQIKPKGKYRFSLCP
jgi:hypothetical protein